MSNLGVDYFISQLGLESNFQFSLNFDGMTGQQYLLQDGSYLLLEDGGHSNLEGGFFNGYNYYQVSGSNPYAESWLMLLTFEKLNQNNGIIFSNYHGSQYKSGFAVGVNNANRLYVETYSKNGPSIYELDVDLASRNAVSINKTSSNLTLSYFDMNSKETISNDFALSSEQFLRSDDWYFGQAANPPSYFSGDIYEGSLDNFYYFTGTIFPNEIDTLFSGFTLASPPEYQYTVIDESCNYNYIGLTGQISNITFDNINTIAYCVQTGYLAHKTGILQASMTGSILNGSGMASGFITGFYNAASGFTGQTLTPFTGMLTGVLMSGVRVFSNTLPTGSSGIYVPFPTGFTTTPVVFTELESGNSLFTHQISGVTNSGFSVWLSNIVTGTGVILNVQAALPQESDNLKTSGFVVDIPPLSSVGSQSISFDTPFATTPNVFCQLVSDSTSGFAYNISNVNPTGFLVTFSNGVVYPLTINYLASTWSAESHFQIGNTNINSGVTSQFINFASNFSNPPIVFGALENSSSGLMEQYEISGVSTSGFNVVFSSPINSNTYQFNSMAWSGSHTGLGLGTTTGISNIYAGQFTDECENIYNLSGLAAVTNTFTYELPLYQLTNFTGTITGYTSGMSVIQIPVNVPISYTVGLNTGQSIGNQEILLEDGYDLLLQDGGNVNLQDTLSSVSFIYNVNYNNNGQDFITANHTLYYNSASIQPTPFYIFKNCNQLMGYALTDYSYNTGYIYSFGMDGVTYIDDSQDTEVSELYVFPDSHNKTNVNLSGILDRSTNTYVLNNTYDITQLDFYENGVGWFGSGYSLSGDIYGYETIIAGDFAVSGSAILPLATPDPQDWVSYDLHTANRDYRMVPNAYSAVSGSSYLLNFDVSSSILFLNGVKLMSGIDYLDAGGAVKIINNSLTGICGRMFTMPLDSDPNERYTGQFNTQLTDRFARGTSMLWANGIRQNLNEQYLEIAKIGLLSGIRTFPTNNTLIFNNDPNFWE